MSLGRGKKPSRSWTCLSNLLLHTKLSHADTTTRPNKLHSYSKLFLEQVGKMKRPGPWPGKTNPMVDNLSSFLTSVLYTHLSPELLLWSKNHRTKRNMTGQPFSIKNVFCLNHFFSNTNIHTKSCVIKKKIYYVLYASAWPSYSYFVYKCGCHHVCLYSKRLYILIQLDVDRIYLST